MKKFYLFKKVSLLEKANFYEYLNLMLDSGITVVEALGSIQPKIKNEYFKDKIKVIEKHVSEGNHLSKAMKKVPNIFSNSEVYLVEAGETSGTLVNSLEILTNNFRKTQNLKSQIKGSLAYPLIIIFFLVISVFIVMMYVVPKLVPLFENSKEALPTATVYLIGTSNFIVNNIFGIVILLICAILASISFKQTHSGKLFFDKLILNLPLIGEVYKNYILAGISSNLGTLMGGGVSIIKTLTLTGRSTNNLIYEDIFNQINLKVSSGKRLVESMIEVDKKEEYFPSDFIQMLGAGEKTGNISKISKKINEQYFKEVNNSLNYLVKFIEPGAILIAGVFVLWFAFAIFGAILKVTQTL